MKKYLLTFGLMLCAGTYASAQTAQTEAPQTSNAPTPATLTSAPSGLASSQAVAVPAEVKGKEGATVASTAPAQLPSQAAVSAQPVSAAPATAPQLASEKSATTEVAAPKSQP